MFSQLIDPRLFNPFSSEKIHWLFCNNTCEPPVPFTHNHDVLLIICSQEMLKTKEMENVNYHHIQPAKKLCSQSSIKGFLNKSLPENKGKLNINTSENYKCFCCEKFQF